MPTLEDIRQMDEIDKNHDLLANHGIPQSVAIILLAESKNGKMTSIRGNDSDHPPTQLYVRHASLTAKLSHRDSVGMSRRDSDAKVAPVADEMKTDVNRRASDIQNSFSSAPRPAFPKPSSIKAKTGNWFPMNGVISQDEILSKSEKDAKTGVVVNKKRDKTDVPANQPTVQHEIPLQELLDQIQNKECKLVSTPEELKAGVIKFQAIKDVPVTAQNVIFSLKVDPPPSDMKIDADPVKMLASYEALAGAYYPLQYRNADEKEFKSALIFGVPEGPGPNAKILPVTGDLDQFITGFDSNFVKKIEAMVPSANKPLNTFTAEGREEMIKVRIELDVALFKLANNHRDPTSDEFAALTKNITPQNIARLGIMTPLESNMNDTCNRQFETGIPHVRELFQHGAEARNPGKQSPMTKTVFFIDGHIHEVNGPEQTAKLLLEKALPKNLMFDVNPQWDMKYFGPVIDKQIEMGFRVPDRVLAAAIEKRQEQGLNIPIATRKAFLALGPRGEVVAAKKDEYAELVGKVAVLKEKFENAENIIDTKKFKHSS